MIEWNDSMSDGCSVPNWLRFIIPEETPEQRKVCVAHDKAYYYGGSSKDRRKADKALREGLIAAGMSPILAWSYWLFARIVGWPYWRIAKVSWSYGENRFSYSS